MQSKRHDIHILVDYIVRQTIILHYYHFTTMNNSNAEHHVVLQMTVKKCTNPRDTAILLINYFVCSRCRCRRGFLSLFTGENASGILSVKYFMMLTCICIRCSVTFCFMTSHWQRAMKMQRQGQVNCRLKT